MLKISKHIILSSIAATLLFSCTKEKTIPNEIVTNDPVFNINGTIDGKEVNMVAGEASYYMYTSILKKNLVDYYIGNLSNGEDEFIIKLSDGDIDLPESNQGITAQNVNIAPNSSGPLAMLNKSLFGNESEISEIEWIVNGNNQIGEEVSIDEPGLYQICAGITFSNGNYGIVCNNYLIGYERNGEATLEFSVNSNEEVNATLSNISSAITEVNWYRNGLLVSNDLEYVDSNSTIDRYSLRAQIIFENGVLLEREVWVDKMNSQNHIEDIGTIEEQSNLNWDYKAIIELTLDGENYIALDDSNTATFEITESNYFAKNANGNDVIKITGSLNVPFRRTSDQEIVNGSFLITFGIAQ